MMCRHPFVRDPSGKVFAASLSNPDVLADGVPFPCGQCLPCRINKRRVWTHRLMLESLVHGDNCFVTLTYDDEHLPPGNTLVKRDAQLFMKRLRYQLEPFKIRYYLAGEYGTKSGRAHYHAILFGVGPERASLISSCWPAGFALTGTFSQDSAQYVAGYVTKKCVKKDDLSGRIPEFALMSRRPGIGFDALNDVAALMQKKEFRDYIGLRGDVPEGLIHGRSFLPFGRYLRTKLREMMNTAYDPEVYLKQIRDQFYEWRFSGKVASIDHKSAAPSGPYFVDYLTALDKNKAARQANRYKIFSRGVF